MKLQIEKAVYGGDGLVRDADDRVVFVPYVLPGELVSVQVTAGRHAQTEGTVESLEVASFQRVTPRCRHFGRCGGCQYQHASYDLQLAMKTDILSETLERAGLRNRPKIQVHAGDPWGYRNRIRLRVQAIEGTIRFGYNLRGTNDFVPIEECPIAAPVLWRAVSAMESLAARNPLSAQWLRSIGDVELFSTADQKQLHMHFSLSGEVGRFAEFCEGVRGVVPELVGVGVDWGRGGLTYVVEGKGYWVSAGGFFQVNRFLLPELVRLVTAGRNGLIAWDLYAGVGLFSRVLAEGFGQVIAVEGNTQAIKDLASAKVANVRGLPVSVGSFLREAVVGRERPDLVVLDPPRAGLGKVEAGLLAKLQVPQIVYVSCDPTTLARDLRVMVDSGYDLAELHLVDLFPQTYHLETVAVLQR
jgi:23S rRNA (uracil1939-C5)-methyltransferase